MNALKVKLLKRKIARREHYRDQAVSLSEQSAGLYADYEIALRLGDSVFNELYKESITLRKKAEWYIKKAYLRELEIRRLTGEISGDLKFIKNER